MSEPMKNPPDRKTQTAKRNLQKEMEKVLGAAVRDGRVPTLFLHSCCAPCSSYVLEYLSQYFSITVFYYNPNISPKEEYEARTEEVQRLIRELPAVHPIRFVEGKYDPECYYEAVRGHEKDPEGGERCGICFEMRLREAAKLAAEGGYDWFTTTLTISPLKNAGASIRSGRRWEKSIMWHFCRRISRKKRDISARLSCRRSIIYIGRITADACSRSGSVKSRCGRRGRKHRDLRGDMFGRR